MQRRLLWAALLVGVCWVAVPTRVQALAPPVPQVGQRWLYVVSGVADFDAPLDVTISYEVTVDYQVVGVTGSGFEVLQAVSGHVVWPTTMGYGRIEYLDEQLSTLVSITDPSFTVSSGGQVDLNNSRVTNFSGDFDYCVIRLVWDGDGGRVPVYVGVTWVVDPYAIDLFPLPSFFLMDNANTMVYWNTSYAPWGSDDPLDFGYFVVGAPLQVDTTTWAPEVVATHVESRQAWKNVTRVLLVGEANPRQSGELELCTWIDIETGLLLKLTEVLSTTECEVFGAHGTYWHLNSTQSVTIELVDCNFLGFPLVLYWSKILGVPLLSFVVVSGVMVVACVVMVKVGRSVLAISKHEPTQ